MGNDNRGRRYDDALMARVWACRGMDAMVGRFASPPRPDGFKEDHRRAHAPVVPLRQVESAIPPADGLFEDASSAP